ncbi:MAG: serine/threonine protein kinase [Candidatus Eremiobacteraeota bacterium]|nr:serine/threonine protein kinase [Candidatus Eremiobacteraeota bacterium]
MSLLLENGTTLAGRYVIQDLLGQGGMGAVYLSSDKHIPEKKWAVKELWDYGDPATRQLIQNQFKREASILATLDHPNLPRITDYFVDNNKEYLVMDYVKGKTLEDELGENPGNLDIEHGLVILSQLIDVLEYLHDREPPVIFRDLKPANIMITPDGNVKLIDFGIARIFSAGKQKDTVIMGTPGYAAPEQYGTKQSDLRSDIYGLGATLYFAVTGQDPADDPFHFDSPSKFNSDITERLNNAILKCVQMDPEERFSNVREIREYLFNREATRTADLKPDLEGAQIELVPEDVAVQIHTDPEELDFGVVKRGKKRKRSITVKGNISKATVSADSQWIRVYPGLIDGIDPEVGVTIYTNSLNHGGKYNGQINIKGQGFERFVPLSVEIETKHLNFLTYLLAFVFTVLSFVPLLGYLGFIFALIVYFSVPKGERLSLKIFLYVSSFITFIYTIVGALYFGIKYLGWF